MTTPPIPRQQRRKIVRDLLERGDKALARGLPRPFVEQDAVGIALALRGRMKSADGTQRPSDVAEAAETLLERTIAADTKNMPLACGKGCSHCCRLLVTCTAPEIFRLAGWIRRQQGPRGADAIAAVTAEAPRRQGWTATDHSREKPFCPLLISHACGVYEARPLPCRSLLSMSASACELAITEMKGQVPLVTGALDSAELVRSMMLAALHPLGRPDAGYDLTTGLAKALAVPDAETRWLAGEDVFVGIRCEPRPPQSRGLQDRLVALMADLET